MTELAYLPTVDDAYVRAFTAKVVALPPGGVVLDRTYFYPTGGGQPADRGTLALPGGDRVEVVDVNKSGPSVVHRIKAPPGVAARLAVDAELTGEIDWERRHRHMRLHTSQHVLSARIFGRTGRRTRRASFSGVRALLDLDGPVPDGDWPLLADDMAAIVREPQAVSIRQIARAEWDHHPQSARSGLVPLAPQVDPVRVVDIGEVDVCPCGGTHLRSTGEIGIVRIEPAQPTPDGGCRVTFTIDASGPSTPTG
jgi:misacylated tRNA(Ala) deacylase